jgi:hypothetical protein
MRGDSHERKKLPPFTTRNAGSARPETAGAGVIRAHQRESEDRAEDDQTQSTRQTAGCVHNSISEVSHWFDQYDSKIFELFKKEEK